MSDELRDDESIDDAGNGAGAEGEADLGGAMEAALDEAKAERLARQAFVHGVDRALFRFLFANCCFFAAAFASWERAAPGADVDPSTLVSGLNTVRGALLLAISTYGFWVSYLNIFHGQMKVRPFLWSALIAATFGVSGVSAGIGRWDEVGEYLKTFESKIALDDVSFRLAAIAPGAWLCAIGSLVVFWVILAGLLGGRKAGKAAAAAGRGRRR